MKKLEFYFFFKLWMQLQGCHRLLLSPCHSVSLRALSVCLQSTVSINK